MLLLGGEFGFEGLDEDAVVVQLVAGEVGEDLQDPLRGGGCAVTELGVEGMWFRAAAAMAVRTCRSMRAATSSARNWQQNSPSIRAGFFSSTGAASWTLLSRWWRRSRLGW